MLAFLLVVALITFYVICHDVTATEELLLEVEGEHFLLPRQDNIASVEQLDLCGAFEPAATNL